MLRVIEGGKISVAAKGKKHYCFHTQFHDKLNVSTRLKYKTDNDNFAVYKENEQ